MTADVIRRYIEYHRSEETTPKQLRLFWAPGLWPGGFTAGLPVRRVTRNPAAFI